MQPPWTSQPVTQVTAALVQSTSDTEAGPYLLALDGFRDVAVGNLLREALCYGGLAHARLTDEARVVLGAAAEDLSHALNLLLPPHHRVQLALTTWNEISDD